MIQFSKEEFDRVKTNGETLYKGFGSVYCPYFKTKVAFNSKGLEHLKFINRDKSRLPKDQFMRFKLIKLAPLILGLSSTLQGIRETKSFEEVRIHSRIENILLPIIIPFWGMNFETMQRVLHEGSIEID